MSITRPAPSEYNPRYERYISLVPETDLPEAMLRQIEETVVLYKSLPEPVLEQRYAEGKWTVREVLGHILDTERIIGIRLLKYSRGDNAPQPRADENLYVRNAEFDRVPIEELLEEYALLRRSHVLLLRHLPDAAWDRTGFVAETEISVRAVAYLMLGHERHHLGIVRDRYLTNA